MKRILVGVTLLLAGEQSFAQAPSPRGTGPVPAPTSPDVWGVYGPAAGEGAPAPCAGGSCGDELSGCKEGDGYDGRVWARAEYLLWWIKDGHAPPLVTTGSPADVPTGAFGQRNTRILDDGSDLTRGTYLGGRFTLGLWLNECQTLGVEAGYFFLGSRSNHFGVGSTGTSVIARPFFNLATGAEDAEVVAFPGLAAGRIDVSSSSGLQGAEANAVYSALRGCTWRVELLGGFRYLRLDEDLTVTESSQVSPASNFFAGNSLLVSDRFATRSEFYGGQLGARAEFRRDRLTLEAVGKVALGSTDESVTVEGSTRITPPGGATTVAPGGLLALPSNSGSRNRHAFACVPEVGVNVGYQVTDHVRASVGYTFLYWSRVVRPGEEVDLRLNATQVPTNVNTFGQRIGPALPPPTIRDTDFWAQGINLGLELRF